MKLLFFLFILRHLRNHTVCLNMQHFYVKITQPFYRIFGKGRRGREEDVPKENFCGWFICGQHCAKPTHQYNRKGGWLFLVKKGCSLEIKSEIRAKFNLQFILFFCYTTTKNLACPIRFANLFFLQNCHFNS